MARPEEYQMSGQVTAPARTATPLGDMKIDGPLTLRTMTVGPGFFVGNDGENSVGENTGFRLIQAERVELEHVSNLSRVYVWAYEETVVQWLVGRVGG